MSEKRRNWTKLIISPAVKTCSNFYQTREFRNMSYKLKKINNTHTDFSTFLKTHTNINFNSNKNSMKTFHKTLMRKKLYSNPKFIEMKSMSYTDRNSQEKDKSHLNNKSNKIHKGNFFLTNNNEISYTDRTIFDYNYTTHNDFYKLKKIEPNKSNKNHTLNTSNLISSNLFLKFNGKKYLNSNYPDALFPKVSDFVEDIKMIRTIKYINQLKREKKKHEYAMAGLDNETTELTVHSLISSHKLLNNFKFSYITYNKYLLNQINKEKNKLDNYITDENLVQEEVIILEKRFDDLMAEFEILTNFKNLFTAIKHKTKIMNNNKSGKSFANEVKERLKQQIALEHQNTMSSTSNNVSKKRNVGLLRKPTIKKKNEKEKEKDNSSIILENLRNTNENKQEKVNRNQDKHFTSINNFNFRRNNTYKKIERFNSLQPFSTGKINKIENFLQNNNSKNSIPSLPLEKYDVQKEVKIIENNIIESIEEYNFLESDIIYLKLLFTQEKGLMNSLIANLIKERISQLDFCKKYYVILNNRYKSLKNRNKDFSLFFLIYRKVNKLLGEVTTYKVQGFKVIIEDMKNIYDKNKLFYQYKVEKNEFRRAYIIKQLVKYLYKVLILIEKIRIELIQKKNEYLKDSYYSEKIIKYENKMDIEKKLFYSKYKRNEDLLRIEKRNQNIVKNLNKIIYRPKRKVGQNYQVINHHKRKKVLSHENENDMIFY